VTYGCIDDELGDTGCSERHLKFRHSFKEFLLFDSCVVVTEPFGLEAYLNLIILTITPHPKVASKILQQVWMIEARHY